MVEEKAVIFHERKYKHGVKFVISSLLTVQNTLYCMLLSINGSFNRAKCAGFLLCSFSAHWINSVY